MTVTISNSLIFFLLLPTQLLGFGPSSSSITTRINAQSNMLYSSPFGDTPSPLEEEPLNDENLSPFDAYTLGRSTSIATKDLVTGTGVLAEDNDVLTVSFAGMVIQTKKEFLKNEEYTFELGQGNTFPGFNEGLIGSSPGTKRLIKVPPNKAYGQNGAKGIPPMSDLMFEVEVIAVAREPVERIVAKIGTDRLLATAGFIAFLAVSPFLPAIPIPFQ